MRNAKLWTRFLLAATCALALSLFVPASRAADEVDNNDPALKKAGKGKMTPEQLVRIRIAELEGGAIADSLKNPETVTLVGPPLTDRDRSILNLRSPY